MVACDENSMRFSKSGGGVRCTCGNPQHSPPRRNITSYSPTGSIGAGGDQYTGQDQFGRIASQQWANAAGTVLDGYTYTYDQNSNVTSKTNVLNSAYSETYTNDNLNRLTAVTRGGAAYQSWNLDSQGNWSSNTTSGTTQTRTTNSQNQITSITGTAGTPQYDANGNMITDQNGNTLKYDALNRLISVTNSSGQVIAKYSYDARGYRVSETYPQGGNGIAAGTTNYIYYDSQWQAIEVRTNGTAASDVTSQTVWSAAYVNSPVLQDSFAAGVIQPGSRIYFLHDANWDTTAVVTYNATTQTWGVAQRYVYSPYGSLVVLNADFSTPPSGTQPLVNNLYQGMTLDGVTGLYYARNRNYSPTLGVWISQDPLQYVNGASTYQFAGSNPVERVDPVGLDYFFYKVEHVPGFVNYKVFLHHSWWKWPFMSYDGLIREVPLKVHKCPPGWSATLERYMQNSISGLVDDWNKLLWTEDEVAVEQTAIKALAATAVSLVAGAAGDAVLARLAVGSAGATDASIAAESETGIPAAESWANPATLAKHFADHGADFGATSAEDYANQASNFLQRAQQEGLPTKIDSNGIIRAYDPETNTFGSYNPNGTTKTFFKPSGGVNYWNRQPGVAPTLLNGGQ
jgi:RHS repeat-associated protein